MELTGTIIKVQEPQIGVSKSSGKEWQKQEILIQTISDYPQEVAISLWGKNADLPFIQEGATITAKVDIASREYNERFYTEVRAYRVFLVLEQSSYTQEEIHEERNAITDDDLPF